MSPIIYSARISLREFLVRVERALVTRMGQMATIVVDTFILAVPVLFLIVQVVFHLMNTGYNPIDETISMYVWCEHGIAQSAVFLLQAIAMFALTARLYFILQRTRRVIWGLTIFILIALGMLIVSICPTREFGAPVTGVVVAHVGSALTICTLFPLSLILIATGFKTDQYWKPLYGFCLYTAAVAIVVGILGLPLLLTDIPGLGIIERILMANSVIWMFVLGSKLIYQSLKTYLSYCKRPSNILNA